MENCNCIELGFVESEDCFDLELGLMVKDER